MAIRLVKVSGQCPHCDVKKHQIDCTEERAVQIVRDAIDAHIQQEHSEVTADA